MASFTAFLLVYLFGGLTFLPLIVAAAIYAWTRPIRLGPQANVPDGTSGDQRTTPGGGGAPQTERPYEGLARPGDDVGALEAVKRALASSDNPYSGRTTQVPKKHRHRPADGVATAGYFAVHRKYVALGVNAKPIEPGSSVGPSPVAPPSPSVYQTFFRSMLNKRPGSATGEVSNAASPRPKNAGNMFYVVLRHGHLILFDDDQQVDVRHVIKLADHDVGIYSGKHPTPEGELFIKRNAIHLSPKTLERAKAHNAPTPQPWFFYSENCSEKEDFYFALLRSQDRAPPPFDIDVHHLTALMERLHASEEAAEMRWLNALLGRLFLGVYHTPDVRQFVASKVITKLSRTPRPNFIASLVVQRVDIGDTTPQITSPRLKSLTAQGECIVEADVRYSGRFEIDVAATLRVSTPIGQQEVKTSLAVVLTHLEGHMLFKIKAPPSNRIWFSFRHMPKIEMEIRPIIMARQLTWPVFIQMIEGKIKEAISESIVLPFWDDTPFFSTEAKTWRGGLWDEGMENDSGGSAIRTDDADAKAATSTGVTADTLSAGIGNVSPAVLRLRRLSKTHTAPTTPSSTSVNTVDSGSNGNSPSASAKKASMKQQQHAGEANERSSGTSPSKRFSMTPSAYTAPSEAVVGTSPSHAEALIPPSSPPKHGKQGPAAMSWLSSGTLRSRKSSASSEGSGRSKNRTTSGWPGARHSDSSDANDAAKGHGDEDAVDDTIFVVSDSETPETGQPRTRAGDVLSSKKSSDALSIGDRSFRSDSAHASSSSLAGMGAVSSSRPSSSSRTTLGEPPTVTTTITSNGRSGGSTTPAKRSAALTAAMTGAAQSAKRWGINALQRRAAAATDRKARMGLDRRTSAGGPLDLSKPIGGGRPLPPPGEPLPLPSDLVLAAEDTPLVKTPARPAPVSRRPTNDALLREQTVKRKEVPTQHRSPPRPQSAVAQQGPSTLADKSFGRRRLTGGGDSSPVPSSAFQRRDDLFILAAPVDSDSEGEEEEQSETNSTHCGGDDHSDVVGDDNRDDDEHQEGAQGSLGEEPTGGRPETGGESPAETDLRPKTTGGSRGSPAADEQSDGADDADVASNAGNADDAQWGELADSVISAFLDGEDEGQPAASGPGPADPADSGDCAGEH